VGPFRWVLALLAAGPLLAQGPYGTTPKPKAADYPAHAQAGGVWLGAEYLVRSIPARNQTLVTQDYLVVEVALYPPPGQPLVVSDGQFTLRMNGKKQVLHAQAPGFVAASLKYPDWEHRPSLVGYGGAGNLPPVAVLETAHGRPVVHVAPRPLPEFQRLEDGHEDFLRPGGVHLLPHDFDDLLEAPPAQGQVRVRPAGHLADEGSPDHQLVRDDFGFRRHFFHGRDE